MSYASVIDSLTPLLLDNLPGIVTVVEANQLDTLIVPINRCPAILLSDRSHTETPLAQGAADRTWWLDCNLWAYYPSQDESNGPFRILREQLEAVLRTNTWLGHNADDAGAGSKLYVSGRSLQVNPKRLINSGNGQVIRRVTVSTFIREAVFFTAV